MREHLSSRSSSCDERPRPAPWGHDMTDLLAQTALNALYAASYLSLVAVGLVLIFGVMGIVNFAHGELFMLGAYVVVALYTDFQMPFFVVTAIGLWRLSAA